MAPVKQHEMRWLVMVCLFAAGFAWGYAVANRRNTVQLPTLILEPGDCEWELNDGREPVDWRYYPDSIVGAVSERGAR